MIFLADPRLFLVKVISLVRLGGRGAWTIAHPVLALRLAHHHVVISRSSGLLTLKTKLLDSGDHFIELRLALPDEVIALAPGSLVNERTGGHASQHLLLKLLGLSLACLTRKYV